MYNQLNNQIKRSICSTNYNQHINSRHPDRILDRHDLLYIRDGQWWLGQDGTDFFLSAGDVILLQQGHHHYGPLPCEGVVRTMFVEFYGCPGDEVATKVPPAGSCYAFPMVVHCQELPLVEKYFERMITSFWSEAWQERAKAAAYLELLLCELSQADASSQSLSARIKRLIQQTPHRFISNEEFAHVFGCSVRTVSAKFKESTGSSLHAWQLQFKCQMAEELLRHDPSITLKEIAANYGFYDEYHFGKAYKQIMGCSPKKGK